MDGSVVYIRGMLGSMAREEGGLDVKTPAPFQGLHLFSRSRLVHFKMYSFNAFVYFSRGDG